MTLSDRTDTHRHDPDPTAQRAGNGATRAPEHTAEEETVLYCTVHPSVATGLRCNRCGRPMCTRCAVKTPVGYRCKECVREQQNQFFNAQMIDYLIAGGATLIMSFVIAAIVARLGFGFGLFGIFLMMFIAPAIGGTIGRIAFRLIGKRRGRHTPTVVGACFVLGALPWLLLSPFAIAVLLLVGTSAAVGQFSLRL